MGIKKSTSKKVNEWKYKKLKVSVYCNLMGYGNIYKVIVKDKWWHLWKTYAKSYYREDIEEIIDQNI
jgi:hypothetical protein